MPSERLRVLYVDHTAKLSGGEIALGRMLTGLPRVDPLVLLGEDGPFADRLRDEDVEVEILPFGRTGDVRKDSLKGPLGLLSGAFGTARYVIALARRMRALRPDLVHTNSLKSGYYGALAARLAGIPVVWHLRDRISEDYLPLAAVRATRLALRWLPDAVICNSQETLNTAGHIGFGDVIPSPVIYDAHPMGPAPTRSGPERPPLTIAMLGRLAPWKGQALFIEAFAQVFGETDAKARIIGSAMFGEAAYEASLHSLVDELGLSGRVEFAGFREDVQRELLDANVLVHASLSPEPFGQVVVEGMAAGLPVVAAAAGGPAEIIESEVNGLLFTPGSVSALATELQRLAQDEALRDRLGAQARIRAALFRPEKVGENVMTLYLRLLERTARRDETKAPWRLGRRTAQGAGQPTGLSQSPYLLRE